MKKFIPTLIIGAFLASATLAPAQEKKEGKAGKRGAGIEQRVNRMAQDLNLKEEQKTKLKAVFEDQEKKLGALREDTSLSRQERQTKGRGIREDFDKKMKDILTPEQFQKMQKNREANIEKFKNRGERRGVKKN
jgi:Spy/CpxP family protein refolding chaperone